MTLRIAGVRPPPTSPRWDSGRLRYADAGALPLAPGDWVVVEDVAGHDAPVGPSEADVARAGAPRADASYGPAADEPWVGEVVVAPEQVVEASPLGALPRVIRLAAADERPTARAAGAGLRLLRSLDLPDWAVRPRPILPGTHEPSASRPSSTQPGAPRPSSGQAGSARPDSAATASPDDHRPEPQDEGEQPGPDPAPAQR